LLGDGPLDGCLRRVDPDILGVLAAELLGDEPFSTPDIQDRAAAFELGTVANDQTVAGKLIWAPKTSIVAIGVSSRGVRRVPQPVPEPPSDPRRPYTDDVLHLVPDAERAHGRP